ncbi:MAG TPA: N-methyl-L-tryptophan oxidase [Acidobacteriota bacterium]|nr:N-methyl-L-tryptophan oxidase [Acidobacteriota bacterium]
MSTYDVIVVGAGTMGSAAAYHLAMRNQRVLVLEQFRAVHELGSHTGYTRIIRHAYFESPAYVPLVLRSDQLWQELEKNSGKQMLIRTGGIDMGPEHGIIFGGALQASLEHKLPHEHLDANEASKRWPQFRIPGDWHVCYDPMAGFLIVETCIRSHLELAHQHGAELHENESVESIQFMRDSVQIRTQSAEYQAGNVVICGGAWNIRLLSEIGLPLKIQRQALGWFVSYNDASYDPLRFPVFLAETPEGIFYGFPIFQQEGIKLARHGGGHHFDDPVNVPREFSESDADQLIHFSQTYMRDVGVQLLEGKICLYTMTPDQHFIIDVHPQHPNCFLAAGFSGHGFKFATVVGEILTDLCINGKTNHPIDIFRIARLRSS